MSAITKEQESTMSTITHGDSTTNEAPSQIVTVLGAQWGDEGKGKLVDILAASADICCRFNGGSNAGHTLVVNGTKYALHLAPCGVLYPHTLNLLGHGMVIHLKTLVKELSELEKTVVYATERVRISSRAHLLFDFHQTVDAIQEQEKNRTGAAIGTTRRGIGPCYSCKMARTGIRVAHLLDWPLFEQKFRRLATEAENKFSFSHDIQEELNRHKEYALFLSGKVVDGVNWIHNQIEEGKRLLIEGANATFLDIDLGTYPCVTSSSTTVGGVCTGLGLPPALITNNVIGVVKAYTTRVGEGPFPTEEKGEIGELLMCKGHERGTTTGRPRRCGWLDVVMVRYAVVVNGMTQLNLTKLDVLTGIMTLQICVAYQHITTEEFLPPLSLPSSLEEYALYTPVYESHPGWSDDISGCETFEGLPVNAQNYVNRIEELVKCPITWIGVGSDRKSMIIKRH